MKLVINHDTCRHAGEFADRCLAASLRHPYGWERFCSAESLDDGRPEISVDLILEGRTYTRVFQTEQDRLIAASEGWLAFVQEGALSR
ncbi:MAG TPA: hypothetical protein VJK02_13945 [Anaerolineales bacterium]|nr:hypothetical protein [Anaerolineales bacterium]